MTIPDKRERRRIKHGRAALARGLCSNFAPAFETAFRRLMMVLQRNQQAFDQPKRSKCDDQDQRQPQSGMQPVWRLVNHFSDQRRKYDNGPADQDHEYRGAIAGIGKIVVSPQLSQAVRSDRKP